MSKLVSFEVKEKYLKVTGWGARDSFASMIEASEQIYSKLAETGLQFMLADYRQVTVNVTVAEAFNIVRRYENRMPGFDLIVTSCVFNRQSFDFAAYWKKIAQARGYRIEIFENLDVAEAWLLSQIENSLK